MKKQFAIIGVSGFGKHHLEQLRLLAVAGIADIAAAVVINPDETVEQLELLRGFNTRIYASTEEFFRQEAGKIDVVCIPTGISSHEVLTLGALGAGMNVLVEKPASGSVASVERMIAAEKASGKFVAVAFQHAYAPEIRCIKRLILSGVLGEVKHLAAKVCWPRPDDYYRRNNWAARREVNGVTILDSPLNNACAHHMNLMLDLNGKNISATSSATTVSGSVWRGRPDIEMFDGCDLTFALDNGVNAEVMFAHSCAERQDPEVKVICSEAEILWTKDFWRIVKNDGSEFASGKCFHPGGAMFRIVASKIDDPSVPVYTLVNALEHTRCVELLDKSCPIETVPAEYRDGVYCVAGTAERFAARFAAVK